jgi:3'(2'), 5'-bisphosphate nucleotidase
MNDRQEMLQLAKELAYQAGAAILSVYRNEFDVVFKADESPLTQADLKAHKIICEGIRSHYPDHMVLSEEGNHDFMGPTIEALWVVDPLDGTKEFVKENDEFTVNIAFVEKGDVVMGVVYAPVQDELYYAIKGNGAYLMHGTKRERLHVSDRVGEIKLLISRSHQPERSKRLVDDHGNRFESVTAMGSSMKGCQIAAGRFDAYYNFGRTMKWDTCAMQIIVEEAGGTLRRLDGQPIDYLDQDLVNRGFYILNREENNILGVLGDHA